MLDKASPPLCLEYIWDYYWKLRSSEELLCSEILAYIQLTGVTDIGEFEVNTMLTIDSLVSSRLAYHRRQK